MAKNRVNFLGLKYIDKIIVIVILRISLWMVVMLVTPFMVFANSTDRIGTNRNDRITSSSSETIVNSSEVDKNEKKVIKHYVDGDYGGNVTCRVRRKLF